jgi:ribonuclease P protein component
VGLIVPRFGKTAVDRNRLKRRFREAIRLDFLPSAPAADVLIRASRRAYELAFHEVRDEVTRVSRFVAET